MGIRNIHGIFMEYSWHINGILGIYHPEIK
jgi:hypothetical protein